MHYWNGLAHRQDEVLQNMRSHGVMRSVQIGTGLEMSRKALDLARHWGPDTWCTAGLHPTDCQDLSTDSATGINDTIGKPHPGKPGQDGRCR